MSILFTLPVLMGRKRNGWDNASKSIAIITLALIDYVIVATYLYS